MRHLQCRLMLPSIMLGLSCPQMPWLPDLDQDMVPWTRASLEDLQVQDFCSASRSRLAQTVEPQFGVEFTMQQINGSLKLKLINHSFGSSV